MKSKENKYSQTLTVRITPLQYTELLETIIKQRKNDNINSQKLLGKSAALRKMIDRYSS